MTDLIPEELAPNGEFLFFTSEDGKTRVECRFESDTLWLTQASIADLYQVTPQAITQHIKAIFDEGELVQNLTCKHYLQVQMEGERPVERNKLHYNLSMIIAIGYRVRSSRGSQFRRWATQTLEEYLVKGFAMDDERLKNPPVDQSMVPDYFDEMLERIRDIRASERRVYLRVREIFAMAADYQPNNKDTNLFFQSIQNKLHHATTGMTAAEIISTRVDADKPNAGLTTFKGDEVRKGDVTIAKNYLSQEEVSELNRIVTMWLDFAEDQALRRKQVFLKDWNEKLDSFLAFNDRNVLQGAGSISKSQADLKAKNTYEQYEAKRRGLKEIQGQQDSISALRALLKKSKEE
ncbi:hypothetical protein PSECIP111854_02577 [Pseudoalteromonas sp. CIP111854]|uniref:Hydroxyacid dehydrogenase n=1 Tax=Pseudoalteromonas holothuriae TaxID=2963714 RepID=A0A9W4W513_9GAMM|nr:RhuM family protein [Pseudoalteromonas sp. CIP111854]CAH9060297.1 hypothetical protein PSECIP111854_02577 [Pseudoalteromonas sp. CIP111854]